MDKNKFAVIETGGKQYIVCENQKLNIEKIKGEKNQEIIFDRVLLFQENSNLEIGMPYLKNHQVKAEILKQFKDKKKIVFKYHSKTRYRKKKGHRQFLTQVLIKEID